jgi:hypothetical protein
MPVRYRSANANTHYGPNSQSLDFSGRFSEFDGKKRICTVEFVDPNGEA